MTEHVVLRRASDARADLQHRRELALIALDDVDEEIREVDLFIEMYHRFSGEVQDECAIHLPNNSNNAPAEDARLEDDSGPSKEGDTTSAATDGIAGPSVSSTDPDGGGSNSPETANQSAGSAVAAVTGENAQLADAVGVEPLPADTNPEQEIGGAEGDVRPVLASSDTSGIPTPALDHPTVKPAGETDGSPAAPSRLERIKAVLTEHPDWTARQIGDELGLHQKHVNAVAEKHELIIRRLTPEEKQQKRIEGARLGGQISRAPKYERAETTAKRREVAALNEREPWLVPHQAASRLQIPLVNLRIFSAELGIAWSPPRQQQEPKSPVSAERAPTISQRVAALRRMHPTWTPALIAAELGIRASDVRAVDAKGAQAVGVTQVAK